MIWYPAPLFFASLVFIDLPIYENKWLRSEGSRSSRLSDGAESSDYAPKNDTYG